MSEPTITCPSCKTEMKLTESLAASLLESTRRDYESRLAKKAQKATLTFQNDLDHKNQSSRGTGCHAPSGQERRRRRDEIESFGGGANHRIDAEANRGIEKAELASQQLQGEVQELELEALLRATFPRGTIEPVPKREYGGDALQRVAEPNGQLRVLDSPSSDKDTQ